MPSNTPFILRTGLLIAGAMFAMVPALRAQEPVAPAALSVSGRVKTPDTWTATRLNTDFSKDMKTVSYRTKDKKRHKSRCVPLWTVLNQAGFAPADAKRKNGFLTLAITAIGGDGYAAMFSYAELSPDYGKRDAYIALDQDGKLPADGALDLLVTSDGKPSRWVHNVRQLIVGDTLSVSEPRQNAN